MIFIIPVVYRCSKIVLTSEHYYAWGGGGLDCEVYLDAGKLNSKARPLNTVDRSRVWVIVGKSVRYRCFPPWE